LTEWLTIKETATLLKCSERTVRRYIKAGKLESITQPLDHGGYKVMVGQVSVDNLILSMGDNEDNTLSQVDSTMTSSDDTNPPFDMEAFLKAMSTLQSALSNLATKEQIDNAMTSVNSLVDRMTRLEEIIQAQAEAAAARDALPWWKKLFKK